MWVLMKVHLVLNTINSFRRASRIMICSLVQHSPESHGIAVILNESAVHGSCWLHSLKGSSDLRTCACFSRTVYSPPLLYRFGKCGLLQRLLGQAVQTSYSFPKSFNATEVISNSCFWVWQKVKAESIPVKNPCGCSPVANWIPSIRGLWSLVQSMVQLFLDSEFLESSRISGPTITVYFFLTMTSITSQNFTRLPKLNHVYIL